MASDYHEKDYDDEVYEDDYYEEHYEEEELEDESDLLEEDEAGAKIVSEEAAVEAGDEAEEEVEVEVEVEAGQHGWDEEDQKKITVSYACDECDYRWDDVIIRKKDIIEDEEPDIICPMCGSMNVTLI
jgi:rubrerythrin